MRRGAAAAFSADRHGARRGDRREPHKQTYAIDTGEGSRRSKQIRQADECSVVKDIFRKDEDRYAQCWCSVAAEHCMEDILSVLSNVELITIRSLREETNNYYGMHEI